MNSERIHIRDLALRCVIGIYPHEREVKQDVLINIAMDCDIAAAGVSDSIEDSVNYKSITKDIIAFVEGSECLLIESLAEKISAICLERERVRRVTVTVDKPGALRFADSVAVEFTRER